MNDSSELNQLLYELGARYNLLTARLNGHDSWVEVQLALRDLSTVTDMIGEALDPEDWEVFRRDVLDDAA